MIELIKIGEITQSIKEDGTVKNHRGPDRIEGTNGLVSPAYTSWLSIPSLMLDEGGFEKK